MNILAIGAHPDDIELGCGGTLIKASKEGHKIYLYTLTRGGSAGQGAGRRGSRGDRLQGAARGQNLRCA